MSDLLIKGLGLPKEGCHHTLSIYDDGSVEIGSKNSYRAVELPPHGRLIDADKLREALLSDEDDRFFTIEDIDEVDNAPTVLEATE